MAIKTRNATSGRDPRLPETQKRVPTDVVGRAEGERYPIILPAVGSYPEVRLEVTIRSKIKFSLRAREPAAIKLRRKSVELQFEQIFAHIRSGSADLTHRQTVALSGEVYRLYVERFHEEPGEPEDWESWKAFTWAAIDGRVSNPPALSWQNFMNERHLALGHFGVDSGPKLLDIIEALPPGDPTLSLELRFGLLTTYVLNLHGYKITAESRLKLLRQVGAAALDAGWAMKRAALGDYTPDEAAKRFPPIEPKRSRDLITLTKVFDHWRTETQPAGSTLTTWRPVIQSLLKHTNNVTVDQLTMRDINTWKDMLVAEGRPAKTINGTHLACVRAILAHGVRNGLVSQNVAIGVKVLDKRRAGTNKLPYEDAEVVKLLALAENEQLPARKWIPLLAACTGARAGELAQLWAERVREKEGVLGLEISPAEDGGSLKNEGSERFVPLHPAAIDAGFLEFVQTKRHGPLFYGRATGRGNRHASKGTVNHLASWIRKQPGFDNPRKAPNHALRYWWKRTADRVGIHSTRADYIQGHKTPGEATRYRSFDFQKLAEDVARIPIPPV